VGKLRLNIAMSLDGFVAGPDPTVESPLGAGGEQLHEWIYPLEAWRRPHGMEGGDVTASTAVIQERLDKAGATIMGRNMFGGGPGPWDDDPWDGWWGDDPPFHHPVFVLTHHPREPSVKGGGTTFTFVTDGIESALEQARAAAGGSDVAVAGGANVAQQYLSAGLLDEIEIDVAPVLLHAGRRLFEDLAPGIELEQLRSVAAPGVTHVKYRVRRGEGPRT
jgi:dihydrofolate reductase